MKTCSNCRHEVDETTVICPYCGALLLSEAQISATRALGDTDFEEGNPKWGTARFHDRMNLVIRLRDANKTFVFDADQIHELVIGRYDPQTHIAPDLDLQDYDASAKGVSRRHAAVIRREAALHIVDLGGPNGTYLNGQRLIPQQPRILRDGDDVRLGHLVLQIRFERVPADAR